jgi:hypothetical protein
MTQIVLTPEQAAVLASTRESITVCLPDGSVAAIIPLQSRFIVPDVCPFTPEEIAAAERESESLGPWYSTKEVLDHLRSLDQPQP